MNPRCQRWLLDFSKNPRCQRWLLDFSKNPRCQRWLMAGETRCIKNKSCKLYRWWNAKLYQLRWRNARTSAGLRPMRSKSCCPHRPTRWGSCKAHISVWNSQKSNGIKIGFLPDILCVLRTFCRGLCPPHLTGRSHRRETCQSVASQTWAFLPSSRIKPHPQQQGSDCEDFRVADGSGDGGVRSVGWTSARCRCFNSGGGSAVATVAK